MNLSIPYSPFGDTYTTMKFYIHHENTPEFTMCFKWTPEDSQTAVKFENVVRTFVEAFNRKHSQANTLKEVHLYDQGKHRVSLHRIIDFVVQDKMDLYVVFNKSETDMVDEIHSKVLEKLQQSTMPSDICKATNSSLAKDLKTAEELRKSGKIRRAVEIYRKILKEEDKKNRTALFALVEIFRKAGRSQVAIVHATSLVDFYPEEEKLRAQMADCMVDIGQNSDAEKNYVRYLKYLETNNGSSDEFCYVITGIGKALMGLGRKEKAFELFSEALRRIPEHREALKNYAMAKAELSNAPADVQESIRVLLTLLVKDTHSKEIQDCLTRVVKLSGSLTALEIEMRTAWDSAAALVFLSTCLRDNGGVTEALTLSKRAIRLDRKNPSVFLFFLHLLEIVDEPNDAFKAARNFLEISNSKLQGFHCSELVPSLADVGKIYLHQNSPKPPFPLVCILRRSPYTADEGQTLAILFTLVRILFFSGAINLLKPMLPIVETFHHARGLHETVIRNEAAYFSTIYQVMRVPIEPLPDNLKFVYFVSDSHCIPPAWRTLEYNCETHVIHPLCVVGMKIWHHNSKSKFYTKSSFYHIIQNIPKGIDTPVIFNFGELDCREGLLTAFEKCKYDSIEDAVLETVEIYVDILQYLVNEYQLKVFVHPVLPILDKTRSIVQIFNKALKSKIKLMQDLHWLKFLDHLLTDNGSTFKPEYVLDGTHVHPKYVSLIESSLKKVKA